MKVPAKNASLNFLPLYLLSTNMEVKKLGREKKSLMFDGVTEKECCGKALPAPCKLSLANQSENLQERRSYINDEVK